MQEISKTLPFNEHLKSLNLGNNKVSDKGGEYIATALIYNKHLISLDLEYNGISNDGGKYIVTALIYNKHLMNLNLKGNCFDKDGIESISKKFADTSLTSLDLGGIGINLTMSKSDTGVTYSAFHVEDYYHILQQGQEEITLVGNEQVMDYHEA